MAADRPKWQVTEVEVNFVEQEPSLTRFTLEHRNIEKFGVKSTGDVEILTATGRDWCTPLRNSRIELLPELLDRRSLGSC